jgi:hypothetical protein
MPLILQPVFNEQSRDEIEQHLMVVRARRMSAVAVYYAGVNAKTHQDSQQPPPLPRYPRQLRRRSRSPTPGNDAETALVGWGARIRTWEWRNQNRTLYVPLQRLN